MTARKKKAKPKAKKTNRSRKKPPRRMVKSRRKISPIPKGYGTITASLILNGAGPTIEFCRAAFGATVKDKFEGPNGMIMHAAVKIGNSMIHIGEAMQTFTTTSSLMVYVKDVDKVMEQAVAAGAEVVMPVQNMFWGDRYGVVKDPRGNQWEIATHVEDVSPAQLKKRLKEMSTNLAENSEPGA